MTNREKALYGIFLLLIWAAFAWFGKTDTGGFIGAISSILTGFGLYHFNARQPAQAPPPPPTSTSTSTSSATPIAPPTA